MAVDGNDVGPGRDLGHGIERQLSNQVRVAQDLPVLLQTLGGEALDQLARLGVDRRVGHELDRELVAVAGQAELGPHLHVSGGLDLVLVEVGAVPPHDGRAPRHGLEAGDGGGVSVDEVGVGRDVLDHLHASGPREAYHSGWIGPANWTR